MTNQKNLTIGLLPLFLNLYVDVCSKEDVERITSFADVICDEYKQRSINVVLSDICCVAEDFESAIQTFEKAGVDAIVTLHLAYSPSLESIAAIAATDLPLVILDTTPDAEFGFSQISDKILCNHGIHGVQDLCNLLLRYNKPFCIEAGHWEKSDVIDRSISCVKGCKAASMFKQSRVGIVGSPFNGMGDFAIPFDILKKEIGLEVITASSEDIAELMPAVDSREVEAEVASDLQHFDNGKYSKKSLQATEASGLGLRRWIEEEHLSAVTINFGDIKGAPGLSIVPFMEASKAMARGIGYGGEGDVLTAAFCGAVAQVMSATTFAEMFCPDWDGNRIFMSHMGEVNLNLIAGKPVLEQRPYPYSPADEPVIVSGCLKPGAAWFLNIAPGANDSFSLVAAPVDVCDSDNNEKIDSGIRGWIQPQILIQDFLKQYSLHGGTHHGVLCYGLTECFVEAFAKSMNWALQVIR